MFNRIKEHRAALKYKDALLSDLMNNANKDTIFKAIYWLNHYRFAGIYWFSTICHDGYISITKI